MKKSTPLALTLFMNEGGKRVLLAEDKIDSLFQEMTRKLDTKYNKGFTPLSFQKQIIDAHLNKGKNVILHAPTGAGKTLAALAPFYISRNLKGEIDFPNQAMYILPLRTLAYSLAEEAEQATNQWKVTTQTGEVQIDPFFLDGDVIFTTIDQALSGALTIPLSLSFRLANINAGAWIGSYLIFDEFHLLDTNRAFQTTIHLLKQLCVDMPLTRFTIMTATLSKEMREFLAKELNAVHIEVTEEDLPKIESQYQKKRKVVAHSITMNADEILSKHQNKTIVIVNQVNRATALYQVVKERQPADTEVFLLHAQLLSDDRKSVEKKLKEYFGKDGNKKRAILIATQIIEVGLDISSDIMLTEISSGRSFLQRIGRNARFENQVGIVHVYSIDYPESSQPWLPYEKEDVEATERYLQSFSGFNFDYVKANEMMDTLYCDKDKEIGEILKRNDAKFSLEIASAYLYHEKSMSGDLIRKIQNVTVLLHHNPPTDETLYLYETISISVGKLKGFISRLNETSTSYHGKIKKVVYTKFDKKNIKNEKDKLVLKNIERVEDIHSHDFIVIHPTLATYKKNVGLILGESSVDVTYCFPLKNDEKIVKRYTFKMDTLEEHIRACLVAYQRICRPKNKYAIKAFANLFDLSEEDIEKIIHFVIVTHDMGKLEKAWQDKALNRQLEYDPMFSRDTALAHTDNPNEKKVHFPDHSILGAVLAYRLLQMEDKYGKVKRSVLTAIAHHHSPIVIGKKCTEEDYKPKSLKKAGVMLPLLSEIKWEVSTEQYVSTLEEAVKFYEGEKEWKNKWCYWGTGSRSREYWLYLFLVRQLRISDQNSFEHISTIRNRERLTNMGVDKDE